MTTSADFPVGTKVRFMTDAERYPFFVVPEGSTGMVVHVTDSDVFVRIDQTVPGLSDNEEWKGVFHWQPDTIDVEFAIDDPVERVKWQVLTDMRLGRIPETVQNFGELHNHVDANDYLQPFVDWDHPGTPQEFELANKVSDAIDAWLRVRHA